MKTITSIIPSVEPSWMRRIRVGTILRVESPRQENLMVAPKYPADFDMIMESYMTYRNRKSTLLVPPSDPMNYFPEEFFYQDCYIENACLIYVRGMFRDASGRDLVVARYADL